MMAILFLVGEGKEDPQVVESLLDIAQHPGKPQYLMAPELPLLLHGPACCGAGYGVAIYGNMVWFGATLNATKTSYCTIVLYYCTVPLYYCTTVPHVALVNYQWFLSSMNSISRGVRHFHTSTCVTPALQVLSLQAKRRREGKRASERESESERERRV